MPPQYLTTFKSMGYANRHSQMSCSLTCPAASMMSHVECDQIGCNSTLPRLKLYGLPRVVVSISYLRLQSQCADYIVPAITVRDLGIHLDSDATMRTHVSKTLASCYGALCHLRTILRSAPNNTFQQLVASLVLIRGWIMVMPP
jgi:hypothetical protein